MPPRYREGLPTEVVERWNGLSPYDQHHLIAVADDLLRSGAPTTVVQAGVLHDIGKPGAVPVGARVAVVLLNRFAPGLAESIRNTQKPRTGLKGIHLLLRHAEEGARVLAGSGVRPEVVWLVRHHESTASHPYLTALQAADRRH